MSRHHTAQRAHQIDVPPRCPPVRWTLTSLLRHLAPFSWAMPALLRTLPKAMSPLNLAPQPQTAGARLGLQLSLSAQHHGEHPQFAVACSHVVCHVLHHGPRLCSLTGPIAHRQYRTGTCGPKPLSNRTGLWSSSAWPPDRFGRGGHGEPGGCPTLSSMAPWSRYCCIRATSILRAAMGDDDG